MNIHKASCKQLFTFSIILIKSSATNSFKTKPLHIRSRVSKNHLTSYYKQVQKLYVPEFDFEWNTGTPEWQPQISESLANNLRLHCVKTQNEFYVFEGFSIFFGKLKKTVISEMYSDYIVLHWYHFLHIWVTGINLCAKSSE